MTFIRSKPEIAWGEGNYDEMINLKYEPRFEVIARKDRVTLKDIFIIKYRDQEGEP